MEDEFPKEYLERLLESKRQIEEGKGKIRKLIEIEDDFPDTLEEPENWITLSKKHSPLYNVQELCFLVIKTPGNAGGKSLSVIRKKNLLLM